MIDNSYLVYPAGYTTILMRLSTGEYIAQNPKYVTDAQKKQNPTFVLFTALLKDHGGDHQAIRNFLKAFGPRWILKNGMIFYQ